MTTKPSALQTTPDLLVIGLGSTGLAALEGARSIGANAIGIDRGSAPTSSPEEHLHYGMRAWAVFGDGTVVVSGRTDHCRCQPRAIVVATGSLDLPLPLPGWHLDGVQGAFAGVKLLGTGSQVVVLRGPHAGAATRHPALHRFEILADVELSNVDSLEITGTDAVDRVIVDGQSVETSHVLLDNGLQPENTLARMTGLPSQFSTAAGGDVVLPGSVIAADSTLLSVVGDACGIHTEREPSIQAARETGRVLAESISGGKIPVKVLEDRQSWPTDGVPSVPSQITPETLVCPDEGVTVAMIQDAIDHGAMTVNDVKRRTRAAMATCQGRDCLWTIRAMLANAGRDWRTPMTARPPVTGINLSELAAIAMD